MEHTLVLTEQPGGILRGETAPCAEHQRTQRGNAALHQSGSRLRPAGADVPFVIFHTATSITAGRRVYPPHHTESILLIITPICDKGKQERGAIPADLPGCTVPGARRDCLSQACFFRQNVVFSRGYRALRTGSERNRRLTERARDYSDSE